jgi:ureidoglycolate lyase
VVVEPLSAAAFAPFGQVVSAGLSAGSSANQGTATRFDWSAQLENARPAARPNLAVFRSVARSLPFEVKLLERHPKSSQLFLPMVVDRYLVVVAPDDARGEPDLAGLRAFLGQPGQGINYRANTWHHPLIALGRDADFAMLAWEDGSALDCEERPLVERRLLVYG